MMNVFKNVKSSFPLFGVFHHTREFFTHMEMLPLPVNDILGTHCHWAVRILYPFYPNIISLWGGGLKIYNFISFFTPGAANKIL